MAWVSKTVNIELNFMDELCIRYDELILPSPIPSCQSYGQNINYKLLFHVRDFSVCEHNVKGQNGGEK